MSRVGLSLALFLAVTASAERAWIEKGKERLPIEVRETQYEPYVQIRTLSNIYDFNFHWNPLLRKLTISQGKHLVHMVEGWDWLYIDGKVHKLKGPLEIFQGHVEVPIEFCHKVLPVITGRGCEIKLVSDSSEPFDHADLLEGIPLKPIQTIVIDPGHGGRDDVGAVRGGLEEKKLTLEVAKVVRDELLRHNKELKTILTREDDVAVTLKDRSQWLTGKSSDLFVSIHVNSSKIASAHGVETYFLGVDATDEDARKVAEFENQAFTVQEGKKLDVKQWLRDLKQTESLSESSHLAELIQESVVKTTGASNRGVKQAMFFVLMGSQIPSALVEMGFVSHAEELARLKESDYLKKIAQGIAEGLIAFVDVRKERVEKMTSVKGKKK